MSVIKPKKSSYLLPSNSIFIFLFLTDHDSFFIGFKQTRSRKMHENQILIEPIISD